MKEIPLTRGLVAKVDDADFPELSKHLWYADNRGGTFYAMRAITLEGGKQKKISMQSTLIKCPKGKILDHRDLDPLNNQRWNLRVATRGQNRMNCSISKGKKGSKFKGVFLSISRHPKKDYKYWIAKVGKKLIGSFPSEESAARAYDRAASESFGDFAKLNFPVSEELQVPVMIRKTKGNCHRVSTPHGTKSKCTTKKKAEAQRRLLRAIEHGYKP